jgi:hypothetical protein
MGLGVPKAMVQAMKDVPDLPAPMAEAIKELDAPE